MNSLPNELIMKIILILPLSDQLSLSKVNTKLNNISSDHYLLNQNLKLRSLGECEYFPLIKKLFSIMLCCGPPRIYRKTLFEHK